MQTSALHTAGMTRWVLIVAAVAICTQNMGGDALPLSADGVVTENEWSATGDTLGLTGQDGLGAKIASLQDEEQEQRRKEDREMLGTHFVRKPQVDGVKVVNEFMDVQEDAQNEDLLKGISHDADVIGAIVDKADKAEKQQATAPAKPVHTLVMHMKDGQPLVAVEAGSKSKATSKAGAAKQPLFSNYEKSIDNQEKALIDKEMAKPLEGEPKHPPAKKDAAPKPADAKEHKQASPPQGKQPQPIVIHSDAPLTPVTHHSAASAASQAVTAAGRAVNTLQDMKAAADADVATGAAPTPSPALVHERIMEQAQASAAKTLARLNKKEAEDQAAGDNSAMSEMFEAALAPPVVEVPLSDAQHMAKITAKYLGTDAPAVPEDEETELVQVKEMSTVDAGASVKVKEAAEAKIYAEATAHALAKAKAKFGFGIFGYDYGYGDANKHEEDHKHEEKEAPAAGSAAGSGSLLGAAPMSISDAMAGHKDTKMKKKKMFEGLNQLDGVMVTKAKAHKKISPGDFMKAFLNPAQDIAHNDAERDIADMTDPDENEQLWQDADTALKSLGFPTMREGGLY